MKDYFAGDGLTTRFYLSQSPFARQSRTVFEEEYASLDATRWTVNDPKGTVGVGLGRLTIAGGEGVEGTTTEMGGALTLQHGQITFNQASSGLIGGLFIALQESPSQLPFGLQDRRVHGSGDDLGTKRHGRGHR